MAPVLSLKMSVETLQKQKTTIEEVTSPFMEMVNQGEDRPEDPRKTNSFLKWGGGWDYKDHLCFEPDASFSRSSQLLF